MPSLLHRGTTVVCATVLLACSSTEPTASVTLTLGDQTLEVSQGSSNTVSVSLARVNFDGDVALSATGLPSGVTAEFTPATLSGDASTSTLTLTAAGTATTGESTVTITASGAGIETRTAALTLTVNAAGAFTLTATPATLSVNRGAAATTTITIARNGTFSQNVTLAATGLPSGVTASFNPATVSGTAATLTLTATAGAALGAATVTVTGSATGVANQSTNVALTVQEAGSATQLTIDFCSDEVPVWMAFMNEGGAWTRLTPDANGTVTFQATPKLTVALVHDDGGFIETEVLYITAAELQPANGVTCLSDISTKTLNGSVTNVGTDNAANITMGFDGAFLFPPDNSFTLSVPSGPLDLVASRASALETNWNPDRVIVRRGVDLSSGASIPTLDFNAAEALTTASATLTVTGLAAGDDAFAFNLFGANANGTGHATFHEIWYAPEISGSPTTFKAVPASATTASDIHMLNVYAFGSNPQIERGAMAFFRNPANQTIALGSDPTAPTVSVVSTTPYLRHRVQAPASGYDGFMAAELSQSDVDVFLYVSAAYLGGAPSTWDVTMPDLSGVSGWNNAWALQNGESTDWRVNLYSAGFSLLSELAPDGTVVRFASYDSFSGLASRSEARADGRRELRRSSQVLRRDRDQK